MTTEEPTKLTLTELSKNKAKLKAILMAGTIVWLFLLFAAIYLFVYKPKSAIPFLPILIAVPLTFLPAINSMSQINKEIKSHIQN
ncbi:hypothetical protein [Pedobacter kyungheensis]|uniref:hypothetical protein n=1 Tax=Pedobacter kyungheensis TaxID=1069985 RepID=UPI0012E0A278|nr:hypothetical protein [Pedobacter kyungheensis]